MTAEGGAGTEAVVGESFGWCGRTEAAESLLRFFLAEGERTRGAEEVGDGWILETARARLMEGARRL